MSLDQLLQKCCASRHANLMPSKICSNLTRVNSHSTGLTNALLLSGVHIGALQLALHRSVAAQLSTQSLHVMQKVL